ncbi:MAG: HDOD domain-containing protein [Acidobacteria bacterium]|nr:HDOD domain-containing protein [Acidobacteriota bacterium]
MSTPTRAAHEEMPPIPATATAILRLASNERVGVDEIVDTISTDAAILSEVLRVANLAFVGVRGEVTSLKQAALFLGFKRVAGIAAAVALRSSLGSLWSAQEVRRCWLHNLATALTAEQMALVLRLSPDEVYSAGLVHDIGRFVLIIKHRNEYVRLLRERPAEEKDFRLRERERFKIDHTAAGRDLLLSLGLPPVLAQVAAGHHDTPRRGASDTIALTHVACRAATAMGCGTIHVDQDQLPENPFTDLVDLLPADHREPLLRNAESLKNVVTTLVGAYERAFS